MASTLLIAFISALVSLAIKLFAIPAKKNLTEEEREKLKIELERALNVRLRDAPPEPYSKAYSGGGYGGEQVDRTVEAKEQFRSSPGADGQQPFTEKTEDA